MIPVHVTARMPTTGVPHAWLSSVTRPKVSCTPGCTKRSAAEYTAPASPNPRNRAATSPRRLFAGFPLNAGAGDRRRSPANGSGRDTSREQLEGVEERAGILFAREPADVKQQRPVRRDAEFRADVRAGSGLKTEVFTPRSMFRTFSTPHSVRKLPSAGRGRVSAQNGYRASARNVSPCPSRSPSRCAQKFPHAAQIKPQGNANGKSRPPESAAHRRRRWAFQATW